MKSSGFSTLDHLYRTALLSSSKFFNEGWCKPEANLSRMFHLKRYLVDKNECNQLVEDVDYKIVIDRQKVVGVYEIYDGHFKSPFACHFPELAPPPIETARFQMILPKQWKHPRLKPMVVQLAGTGDHFFWRRRELMAKPLAKKNGVASILLENPFYGYRKPNNQKRSCLRNVTDLFIMGGCLVMESMTLLDWCEKQGFGPLGLTGISMGGHMSSLAACNYNKPVALVPCLSWSTASGVFTQGVMANGVSWDRLQTQYFSEEFQQNETPIISALRNNSHSPAFKLGQQLVQEYTETTNVINSNISTTDVKTNTSNVQESSNRRKSVFEYEKFLKEKIIPIFEHLSFQNLSFQNFFKTATKSEVKEFMRGVMDEFTHLAYFSKPVDPSLIIVVTAIKDAYVPRTGTVGLSELWPEAEFRYIANKGHIGAFLFEQPAFRKAVVDALDKNARKYYNDRIIID